MKKIFTTIAMMMVLMLGANAQTVVYQEGFEGVPAVTSGGSPGWSLNTTLYNSGTKSYFSSIVTPGDSSVMITNAFSTFGNTFVILEFSHICKIEFFDAGELFVSNDNGVTWNKLTHAQYLGNSNFSSSTGDKFTATAYNDWVPGTPSIPSNAWWKPEIFDISVFAANAAQVKVMFMLRDINNQTVFENWGWVVDDIKVTGAISELTPPTIALHTPILQDTAYNTGPYDIYATITDTSGIALARLVYDLNSGTKDTLVMVNTTGNTWMATIPSFTYTNTVNYYLFAVDSSISANHGQTQVYSFYIKKSTGSGLNIALTAVATHSGGGATTYGPQNYNDDIISAAPATLPWGWVTSNGWIEYTWTNPATFNKIKFWKADRPMNSCVVQIWDGTVYQNIHTYSGTASEDSIIFLTPYSTTKLRFNTVAGGSNPNHREIQVFAPQSTVPLSYDAGVSHFIEPATVVYTSTSIPVKVRIKNFSVDTLNKVSVGWSVDGIAQTPYLWTGILLEDQVSPILTVGNYAFSLGNHVIKVWTSMPNDSLDQDLYNDTLSRTILVCGGILSGNYTVGPGGDYANLQGALSAMLQCGVGGPVVFNFLPNAGPMTGGIEIGAIPGISAINTVTFKGNGTIINQGAQTYILAFNGAQYITLDSFQLINTTPATNIFGVMIRGASKYINIINCKINVGMTSTSSATAGIAVSNSTTSATTAGDNGRYLTIANNEVIGGYYGITLAGASSYLNCFGNLVANNIVRDFYAYGIYLANNDTTVVTGNSISRPNRTTLTTFYGIYATTSRNIKYTKNQIHSSGVGSYTAYPFYITTSSNSVGYETEIINNAIYNIQTTSTIYAMYILGTNNAINFYYNTINLHTTSANTIRNMFLSTAPNNYKLRNNILSISGTGTGTKYLIYVTTTSTTFSSNYNDFYIGTTTGTNYVGYWSANQSTFANWKTASQQDANSYNIAPPYITPTDFRLSNTLLSAKAIAIPGVTDDIFGTPRSQFPTIGAYEIPLIPKDAGVLNIVTPTSQSAISEGGTVPVTVTIQNFGTDTLTSINVYYTVNQGTPVLATYTGQLLPLQTTTLVMPSYISPAGNTKLCAYTVLPGDSNSFNDTACISYYATPSIDAMMQKIMPINGGCGLGLDTVKVQVKNIGVMIIPSGYSVSYKVDGSSTVVNQTVPVALNPNDSMVITFNTPVDLSTTVDSIFQLRAWVSVTGDNVQYNDTAGFNVTSYAIPPGPVPVTPVQSSYSMTATLTATSPHTILWYQTLTSTTPIGVGTTYQTPVLYDSTTFYVVSRSSAGCESTRVPVDVFITGYPSVDAGVVTIMNPAGSALSGVPQPIQVLLKNFGLNTLQSVSIVWSLNTVVQDTFMWTGSLVHGATAVVTIDTATFLAGNHCITAWSILPNGVPDPVSSNDAANMCFYACMGGVYTIGPATTGTYDFNTFNSALTALATTGPCGQVVFNVYPGTYTEQLSSTHIMNSNINNTIVFQGVTGDSTDVILQYAATSSTDNWVIRLIGGSYFTFKHMTIKATGASYGRVLELSTSANHNTFTNCRLESSTTSTSSNFAVVYSTSTNSCNNFTIANCVLKGGYYGIYWYGSSSSILKKNKLTVTNNVIEDYYYYGIYTYYTDSVYINGNRMANRTGSGALYPLYVGYTTGYGEVTRNNITSTGTSTHYGIYIAYKQAGSTVPMLVANNMLTQSGNLTGTVYGMYVIGSNYVNVYFNTIRIAGGSATAGRALYQSTGASVNFVNNIFSNHNGGYAYYVNTPGGVGVSNHNNYYTTGSALAYWGAIQTTLANLRSVNNQDLNSHNLNPPFVSAADLHLATTLLSAKATYISQVTTDIDGDPRTLMPTIGADEIPLIAKDAGVLAILSPGTNTNEGQLYPVQVTVANFGLDTIYSMTIQYSVNSGTPVSVPFTGAIPSMGNVVVTLPDMTSPAGNYTVCAKTILTGDNNTFNDEVCKTIFGTPQKDAQMLKIVGLEDGCNVGLDTISIWVRNLGGSAINSPTPSTVTVSYRIKPTLPAVTENFTMVVQPNDSVLFHFGTMANFSVTTVDDTFKVAAWIDLLNDNVKYNDTATATLISLHIPPPPVVVDDTIPYGTSVTLFAQSPDSVMWFASDTASVEIGTGAYFTTPVLYTNTTYWVQASTGVFSSSGPYTPGANIAPQAIASASNCSTGPCSALNDLVLGTCGTQLMWISTSTPPTSTPHVDWIDFEWPAPVNIDGMKIHHAQNNARFLTGATMYKWDNNNWVSFHTFSNLPMQCENTFPFPFVNTKKLRLTSFQMTGTGQLSNPNFREIEVFEATAAGCSSIRVPLTVVVSNQQPCDVGVSNILEPITALNLGSQETVKLRITNYGTQAQSNIPVTFQVNNMPPVTETVTASIAGNGFLDYTFVAKANLSVGGNTYQIKAWTSLTCDATHQNDTSWKSVTNLLPVYCVSKANYTNYEEIGNVTLHTLNNTSGPTGVMYTDFTTTVLPPMLSPGVSYPMTITSVFAPGYSTQYSCWVKAWIDLNRDGVFDQTTEEVFSQGIQSSGTVTASITIPYTAMTGNTVMRVVLNQTATASAVTPCGTYSYGETEDYMVTMAPQAACDAGVIAILEPASTTQSGTPQQVKVKFMNFGSNPIAANTLSIAYRLNGGTPVTVNYPGSMLPGAIDSVIMPAINVPMGNNTLCAYTILGCDSTTFNNEICKGVYGVYYTTVPFFDDFETSNIWYKPAVSTNWQYGTPSASIINTAYSGTKAWVTNLTGDYSNNANEYLYTPIYNFSGLGGTDTITLSFYHWVAMAASDYGRVQYTTDGGQNWTNLGFLADPLGTNWYNTQSGGIHYFSLTNTGWMYSAYKLDPNTFNLYNEVQFRFHLWSNASGTSNGWAIDNFRLALPLVPNDVGVTAINYPINDTAAGSQVYAKVTITNFGTNPQMMIPLVLKRDGVTVSSEVWSGTLAPQASTTYTFVLPFTVPSTGFQLCAETQLPGDAFIINDGKCHMYNSLPAYHDVGAVAILMPPDSAGLICFYHQQSQPWYQHYVVVRLRNYGQNTQSSIPLKYSFNAGGTVYNETWSGSMAMNDSADIILMNKFLPVMGAQQVCVETDLLGDGVSTNNKACRTYTGVACIGIDEQGQDGFALYQNIPNPATHTTIIGYRVPQGGDVTFGLVNLVGQVLHTELHTVPAGQNQIELSVSSLAAGVYYYYVEYNGQRITRKLVIRN